MLVWIIMAILVTKIYIIQKSMGLFIVIFAFSDKKYKKYRFAIEKI